MKTELELLLIQRYSSTNTSLQAELHLRIEVACSYWIPPASATTQRAAKLQSTNGTQERPGLWCVMTWALGLVIGLGVDVFGQEPESRICSTVSK